MGTGNQPIVFDLLDGEGNPNEAKFKQLRAAGLGLLKATMGETEFAALAEQLGVEEGETEAGNNADVIAKLDELIAAVNGKVEPPKPKEEGDGAPEDRAAFIKKCIEEGGDMKTCSEKYKGKYPDTPEMKEEEMAALQAEIDGASSTEDPKYKELMDKFTKLTDVVDELRNKNLSGEVASQVKSKVDELTKLGHIAPAQVESVIELAGEMAPGVRDKYLDQFRKQRFTGFKDVGIQTSTVPGEKTLTEADRLRIIKEQGIDEVLSDAYKVPAEVKAVQGANQ